MAKARPRTSRRAAAPRQRVSTRRITPAGRTKATAKARARTTRSRALTAPDTVQVTFDLRDVAGQRIVDPETFFTFRQLSGNRQLGDQLQVQVPGRALSFTLPARNEVLVCEVDPKRYRFAFSPVFFGTPGTRVDKTITLWREPEEWSPSFTGWDTLPRAFAPLRKVLRASRQVTLFNRNAPDAALFPRVDGAAYDDLAGTDVVLAKTSLLNIFSRLQAAREPIGDDRSWFSFVSALVSFGRERMLAMVEPVMFDLVSQVHEHIDRFSADYERTPAGNHRPNVPAALQSRIVEMVSIKSSHRHGNFQLTLTKLRDPDDVLLDADIDESGDLLGHCLDLFKHRISGGTHPHDIHEILVHQHDPSVPLDLGYRLV